MRSASRARCGPARASKTSGIVRSTSAGWKGATGPLGAGRLSVAPEIM
jgi:hypothetical protein